MEPFQWIYLLHHFMSPQKLLHVRLSPQILLLDPPEVSHHDADEDVVFVRRVTTRRLACVTTCPPQKTDTFQIHDAHWEHENILNASRCQKRPFLPHHSGIVGIRDGQDIAEVFCKYRKRRGHGQLITMLIKIQAEPHHEKWSNRIPNGERIGSI